MTKSRYTLGILFLSVVSFLRFGLDVVTEPQFSVSSQNDNKNTPTCKISKLKTKTEEH